MTSVQYTRVKSANYNNKWAKFSFDILGINAENLKVNKCSHKNKSEQMSI